MWAQLDGQLPVETQGHCHLGLQSDSQADLDWDS